MAERKLNFNAPLLSTRRMQKPAFSVRRNKTFSFSDDVPETDASSSSVSLPVSEMGLDQVSVPFTWEQAPGRLKGHDFTPKEVFFFTPCLPPGKVVEKPIFETRLQSLKCKQVEESEDEDDVFSDARDTLSLMDSSSVNHSLSGVSGYGVVETKKPLHLREEDPQSRGYMLDRFLPAAQAMTVDHTPHYASNRKPSTFISEPTIQKRELVPEKKQQSPSSYVESVSSPYHSHQHQDISDEDSEKDDDAASEYAYLSKRGCGMLPQLCFKDSLGMLNTVPGFKSKHNPLSHDQVKSSKVAQLKSRFQSVVKKMALDSVSKHKYYLTGKIQSPLHPSVGKSFSSESNMVAASSRSSSPYRHPRCLSPLGGTCNSFSDTRKETENLRANRLNNHLRNIRSRSQEVLCPKENGLTSCLVEKTLYVDTETNDLEEADKAGTKPDANLEVESFESTSMVNGDESGKNKNGPDRSPLAPPSPKKPSESWLLHNLPSATSQIHSRRHTFHHQKQEDLNEKNYKSVTKWETIVKTSYMHRGHIRFSDELVAHTSLQ